MPLNIAREQAVLQKLPLRDLAERYAEVYGEPTQSHNKEWLVRRILWRMQVRAEGDLTERARRRAAELADDAELRCTPPKTSPIRLVERLISPIQSAPDPRLPAPGTVIVRIYKGDRLEVKVLADGLEYQGEYFRTLSSVAKYITGSHCNGYSFFGLNQPGGAE